MMKSKLFAGLFLGALLIAQEPNPTQKDPNATMPPDGSNPIYRVDVVARTTKAVSYHHRGIPTEVGFAGTVLLPEGGGEAWVKKDKGAVEVDAKFKNLPPPDRFGRQYLTYVLWAITPEGRATNLGELIANSSNKAKIETATELQTFALIVTAEPYYSVSQPSDVVVMENVIRPHTTGRIHTVDAKYELLPRGRYSYDISQAQQSANEPREKLSQKKYEALVELYQARNAVNLARSHGAEQFATNSFQKAERQLQIAESYYHNDADPKTVVTASREATQTAEDSRIIALRRQDRNATDSVSQVFQPGTR